MNATSGIITLKTIEWSKITKITRIHRSRVAATMYSSYYLRNCVSVFFFLPTRIIQRCTIRASLSRSPSVIFELDIILKLSLSFLIFFKNSSLSNFNNIRA